MLTINTLNKHDDNFWTELDQQLVWDSDMDQGVLDTVTAIIADIRHRGDAAVVEYTQRFDHQDVVTMAELLIPKERLQAALEAITAKQKEALVFAAERIRAYAQHQKITSWEYTEEDGSVLGQQITALDKVGLYVPGGKAAYPSSVLMNAIPAKVAGVEELIMVVPTPEGKVNELVFAAAAIAGVDQVYAIGGAQAIAALAYGTETIPQVDKIVGPGNIYVATAKRMVFGTVGIDMIAGPSEILVICDGKTDPDWIAMDLFSQAEHDEDAQAILISDDAEFLQRVEQSMNVLLEEMPRKDIITCSIESRGLMIQVENIAEAVEIANHIAPEHLELSVDNAEIVAKQIRHAGAIFIGRYTAEALGDYCAGPNHVLPTSRTARFSSPLGVYDFQKRSSLIACSTRGSARLGKVAALLAYGEGLTAHARSAEYRVNNKV
ncbi:MAG TPA: histidinol dehydrogenase [Thiothrix sp.]|nr:histidinol dehydrogenase [Thiothrix sp.]